jgi:hypothetical protein
MICQNGDVLGGNGVAYLEINKLPCLHEIDIPKCINVYSIYRTKLGVISFFLVFSRFISHGEVLCYNRAKINSFILKCLENLLEYQQPGALA